ncbi:MAG TPA: lysylphosphatidylglycerol synthase domain-containing protein [Polyangiaceae bacterium]|nr:lysylphosphatidylglycerol synthase domain-containing protein [Polyangiaceae bacterium]
MSELSTPAFGRGTRAALIAVPVLLYVAFRNVDVHQVGRLVRDVGPGAAALLLLPSLGAALVETLAFRGTFRLLGMEPGFGLLLRVRVATEALGALLPLGTVWAEAVRPALIAHHDGAPVSAGLAAGAARKYVLGLSQAIYLMLGFVLGRRALEAGFVRLGGSPRLALAALAMGGAILGAAELGAHTLRGGRTLARISAALRRIPSARIRRVLDDVGTSTGAADGALRALFTSHGLRALAAPCLAAWLLEALETWAILRVLSVPIGPGDALGIETLVVLARQLLIFLPGGLGALELGYAAFLVGPGLASVSACAAFVLLKRLRELLWLAAGGAALVHTRARPSVPSARADLAPSVPS